ncbi:MAG: AMP-dependent synthetase/ligase, partial [Bacteroidota bacterium]
YREFAQSVRCLAASLQVKGIQKGDRIALMSHNRPEWPLWDLAALSIGAVIVPIYPTLTPKQVEWIVNDSQARLFVVSDAELLTPLLPSLSAMPSLQEVCMFDLQALDCPLPLSSAESWLLADKTGSFEAPALATEDLATIIYTSGTTGDPKGVMLSHGNLASNALALVEFEKITSKDSCLSFLPLSHAFERQAHYMFFTAGGTISYAENVAAIVANLAEVRPTIVVSVPRVFEKVRSRMLENMLAASPLKKNLFFWSLRNGKKALQRKNAGQALSPWLALKLFCADTLVFRTARKAFGGNLRFFVSGGAPLVPEVGDYFKTLGFEILEGYGLTETSPVIAANQEGKSKIGTVGTVMPGITVRLGEDGEIQVKGPNVMMGYFNRPDLTAEVLKDGWFSTGDIGEWENGYLKIVDRKKELLIMSNGKNVAPQPIENALKKSKLVTMAMIVGDRKNFLTALIVPNWDPTLREAKKKGIPTAPRAEMVNDPRIKALFRAEIDRLMADYARFEQLKDFVLLEEEFSQEKNELTPTLKYKRQIILEAYRHLIEPMYGVAHVG